MSSQTPGSWASSHGKRWEESLSSHANTLKLLSILCSLTFIGQSRLHGQPDIKDAGNDSPLIVGGTIKSYMAKCSGI